jgi:D-glycero-D-manno-heptose 1,7-bisphosphate phosphatase
MCALLAESGAWLEGIYVCPHGPEEGCPCRKPRAGLVRQAAEELGFDPGRCVVVGDKACDLELGRAVGARTCLVRTGYGRICEQTHAAAADLILDDLGGLPARLAQVPFASRPISS